MDKNQFAIVHFDTDNSVEVVPSVWINGEEKLCYFPDNLKGKKLTKAVKTSSPVNKKWQNHGCTVMKFYGNSLIYFTFDILNL